MSSEFVRAAQEGARKGRNFVDIERQVARLPLAGRETGGCNTSEHGFGRASNLPDCTTKESRVSANAQLREKTNPICSLTLIHSL